MSCLLVSVIAVILFSSEAFGKTVTGLFRSEVARQQNGQFITKFMYQGNDAAATCHSSSDRVNLYLFIHLTRCDGTRCFCFVCWLLKKKPLMGVASLSLSLYLIRMFV